MAIFTSTIILNLVFVCCCAQTAKLIVLVRGIGYQIGGALATGIFVGENFPKLAKSFLEIIHSSHLMK